MNLGKQRILILGGGFAGVYTAVHLEKGMTSAERKHVEITLVSQENYMVFQPFLPEIISGTLDALHAIIPIRRMVKRTSLITRDILSIDLESRSVTLAPEFRPKTQVVPFDHLVIALGSRLNYDLVPGMRDHAIAFKYLGDALRLRNAVVQVLEEADNETDLEERRRLLTFIVAGGGFSGVECVAELHDFLKSAIGAYHNLSMKDLRVILLQRAERILPELSPDLAQFAHDILVKRGVEIQLGVGLQAVTADGAVLSKKGVTRNEFVGARIVVATVQAAPHELVSALPFAKDKSGRILVTSKLHVEGRDNIWSLGDCAAVPQVDGIMSPPTAQHSIRQAATCARNLLATLRGKPMQTFAFTGLGKLASLGHRSAVAEVMGMKVKGILAWLIWRAVYLSKFPTFDRKWRILTDWILDIFLPRDITEVRIFHQEAVAREHYHENEVIFEQQDYGDKVYVVVKGEAEVIRDGQKVNHLMPGDVFGEMALIADKPRNALVKAVTPLDLIAISRTAFETLVTHLPGVKGSMDHIFQTRIGHPLPPAAAPPDSTTGPAT